MPDNRLYSLSDNSINNAKNAKRTKDRVYRRNFPFRLKYFLSQAVFMLPGELRVLTRGLTPFCNQQPQVAIKETAPFDAAARRPVKQIGLILNCESCKAPGLITELEISINRSSLISVLGCTFFFILDISVLVTLHVSQHLEAFYTHRASQNVM